MGLRGGGGNFGVVTSLRVRLHPVRDMFAGSVIFTWNEASGVLRRYAAFAATAPDELGVSVGAMSGPNGEPVIMVVPLWNGERRVGERAMEDVRAFGAPLSAQVGPATYLDLLAQFDAWVEAAEGCHWELRTRSLPALTAGAADAIIGAKARAASPYCAVFWHHFHGAATRMAPDGAAFGLRREHLMVEIVAGWNPDGDDGAAHRRRAHDLWQSLCPFALPGGYANLLGPGDREQAAGAYGGNAARLRALKRRFDPDGVFASAIPLPEGQVGPVPFETHSLRAEIEPYFARCRLPLSRFPSGGYSMTTLLDKQRSATRKIRANPLALPSAFQEDGRLPAYGRLLVGARTPSGSEALV